MMPTAWMTVLILTTLINFILGVDNGTILEEKSMASNVRVDTISRELTRPKSSLRGINSLNFNANIESDMIPRSVLLPLGKVNGIHCSKDMTVTKYLGIPYADPPLGDSGRFKPPRKYSALYPEGGLMAQSNAAPCGSLCLGNVKNSSQSSENCLFMNIWVPPEAALGTQKVPVRVYIHGGDLVECSASDPQWDGCQVASKGKFIQVNIQFRLGAFGMLAHPITFQESNTTGNWGLLDQQMALRWIKDHISYFGGDPTKILLNGHSRGGQMVDFQMVIPSSQGLFSSAISQSAPCVFFRSLDQAYNDSLRFMTTLGCAPNDSPQAQLSCMRQAPYEVVMRLTRAMQKGRGLDSLMCNRYDWNPTFHHVVDGTLVPHHVLEAYKTGQFNKVPYMGGFTTSEWGQLSVFYTDGMNSESVDKFISMVYPGADPKPIKDAYSLDSFNDSASPVAAQMSLLFTHSFFSCPTHQRLAARANNADAPTYFYWWGVTPSCPPESEQDGPNHGTDLWYTFAVYDGFTSTVTPTGTCKMSDGEVEVSRQIVHAHRSMADTGIPSWLNGTAWKKYNPIQQFGSFIGVDKFLSRSISFKKQCSILLQAKQLNQ